MERISNTQPTGSASGKKELGQDDFLMLLTTQMQNQDPSKPMDPSSFITDLTQMSQLESTNKMQATMEEVSLGFKNLQVLQGSSLIGKSVEAVASSFSLQKNESQDFGLDSPEFLENVKIDITDKLGNPVKTISIGNTPQGLKNIEWDGLNNVGDPADSGDYTLSAYGENSDGETVSINTIIPTKISSINVKDGGNISLTLANGETTELNSVRRISD